MLANGTTPHVTEGETFATIFTPNYGDHLHFEEIPSYENLTANSDWTDGKRESELDRLDPLRSMRNPGGTDGLRPAPSDSVPPKIFSMGLIHQDTNPHDTAVQKFPRLSAEHPDSPAQLEANNNDFDDTWVVWGGVDAWAHVNDPGIDTNGDTYGNGWQFKLGIYDLVSDFSYALDGTYIEFPVEVESPVIEGPLSEYLGDSFAYHSYDTVPDVVSPTSRADLAQQAFLPLNPYPKPPPFRTGSLFWDYYSLHDNPFGQQNVTNDHQQPYRGMNRFWNTAEGIFDPEDNPNTSPLDMTLFAKYPDGPYDWEVTATDINGNTTAYHKQVVIDNMLAFPTMICVWSFHGCRAGSGGFGFVFNFDRDGVVLDETTKNSPGTRFEDPSSGPFEVLIPARISEGSHISYKFSEPVKNTVIVDGNTLIEMGKISNEARVSRRYIDHRYEVEYYNLTPEPEIHKGGLRSFGYYRGDIFGLDNEPDSRVLKLSGVDYANNPLDYSPETFSLRDSSGNFTDGSDAEYFGIECYFDYEDPEINSLDINADYDVSIQASDSSNSDFFDGSQPVEIFVQWSRYYWGG